jgi:hypothetical protein
MSDELRQRAEKAESRVAELEARYEVREKRWLKKGGAMRAERDAALARVAELEARERRLWAVLEGVSRGYVFGSRAFDYLHDRDLDALEVVLGVEVDDE